MGTGRSGGGSARCRFSPPERLACSLAWCDPPFASWAEGPAALVLARESGLLEPGAEVVLEAPPKVEVALPGFSLVRELRGAVLLRSG